MTSSAGILLALLLFPLTVWLIIFDRLPSGLTSLFSSPIDADRLKAAALLRAQPDPFDDEERPAWSPSPRDQLEARTWLARLLPPELALEILDLARYYTLVNVSKQRPTVIEQRSLDYLVSRPLRRAGRLQEIRIGIRSMDQGFSSFPQHYGTYEGSSSYFDAFLRRPHRKNPTPPPVSEKDNDVGGSSRRRSSNPFSFPDLPATMAESADGEVEIEVPLSRTTIQYNVHAGQYLKNHTISILRDPVPGGFAARFSLLRMAQPNDTIVLEATAKYPAWLNRIAAARIDLYYAFFWGPPLPSVDED